MSQESLGHRRGGKRRATLEGDKELGRIASFIREIENKRLPNEVARMSRSAMLDPRCPFLIEAGGLHPSWRCRTTIWKQFASSQRCLGIVPPRYHVPRVSCEGYCHLAHFPPLSARRAIKSNRDTYLSSEYGFPRRARVLGCPRLKGSGLVSSRTAATKSDVMLPSR